MALRLPLVHLFLLLERRFLSIPVPAMLSRRATRAVRNAPVFRHVEPASDASRAQRPCLSSC
jgi:hypothetical protein